MQENFFTLVVGQMQTNCYVVYNESTHKGYIIDPGDDGDYINETLLRFEIDPLAVLLTHGHFDHCLAAYEVQSAFNIPCYMHGEDNFLLERLSSTVEHFTHAVEPVIAPNITSIEKCIIKDFVFSYYLLPGHTPGSLGYFFPNLHAFFIGDSYFAHNEFGRTDFSYANRKELITSLQSLQHFDPATIIYPGHGESFPISDLKNIY